MQRYLISQELKEAIQNSGYGLQSLSTQLGFNVKNFIYCNKSINQEHLEKIQQLLQIPPLELEEYKQDYVKNLGIHAQTQPIKSVQKNQQLAEFIGVMLGDGNIYENAVKITCDKRWPEYVFYIEHLFIDLFGISPRRFTFTTKNVISVYVYNKNVVDILLKFGLLRGDKIANNIGIPLWVQNNKTYSERCLRGLIDTDGCLYWCKRDRKFYFNFKNVCKQIYHDFGTMTDNLGYHFVRSNTVSYQLYRKNDIARFIQEIRPLKAVRAGLLPNI